jgi:hypothetical protein
VGGRERGAKVASSDHARIQPDGTVRRERRPWVVVREGPDRR